MYSSNLAHMVMLVSNKFILEELDLKEKKEIFKRWNREILHTQNTY